MEVADLEVTTRERYEDLIRLYIVPTFGDLQAGRLEAELLERFYARLHRCKAMCGGRPPPRGHVCTPLSTSTTRKIHYVLRGALGRAARWGYVSVNAAELAQAPSPRKPRPDPPSAREAADLLNDAWTDPEWGLLLWLTMITGLRRGELCALRWRHLDLDRENLWVERSTAHSRTGLVEKDTSNPAWWRRRTSRRPAARPAPPAARPPSPDGSGAVLVRYADDFVVLCHIQAQAVEVKARLAEWLNLRGLAFNEGKTTVVPVTSGFDFLGLTIRRYPNGKLLITPSAAAIRRIKGRLRAEVRSLGSAKTGAVPYAINPIVRGWAAYYRHGVAKRVFTDLDAYLWGLTWWWARRRHPKKPKRWIVDQYYGRFNRGRQDRWVFGDRDGGLFLHKFAWTRIVRHEMVKGAASTDDPTLTDYWAGRRRRKPPPLDRDTLRLLQRQQGRCPRCGRYLLHADHEPQTPEQWEDWLAATRKAITRKSLVADRRQRPTDGIRLIHTDCYRRTTGTQSPTSATVTPLRLA